MNIVNVVSGVTTVTDQVGSEIFQVRLDNPFDLVLCDDEKTMREVSSIKFNSIDEMAFRDVLVRIPVIAISCFGLFRSPDPAVFLSSYFYSK